MNQQMTIEDYRGMIGESIGVSDWIKIDQDRVDGFAQVTDDHQYIHVDPVKAADTPFGGTIAHGYLTLSLLSKFGSETLPSIKGAVMGINYGLNKVRFLMPVKVGQSIRAKFTLKNIEERGEKQILSTVGVVIEIENEDTPACIAESLGLTVFA